MSNTYSQQTNRLAELCDRLQNEVNGILGGISDKSLFAEFREEEIVNIYNPADQDIVRQTLEERVIISPIALRRAERKQLKQLQKIQKHNSNPSVLRKAANSFGFLFKRFEM